MVSSCRSAAPTASFPGSSRPQKLPGSPWPTSRWPNPPSRRCSSDSPGRTSATDGCDNDTRGLTGHLRVARHAPCRPDADPLGDRRQLDVALGADPARPGGPLEAQDRVHRADAGAAVPSVFRLPLRLSEDRPGHRCRQRDPGSRVGLRHRPRARRGRAGHHVPGHSGRRHAAGAGVRLHPRDRRPRAGALPHLARGDLQGDLRRRAGTDLGGDRAADRVGRPRRRGRGPTSICTGSSSSRWCRSRASAWRRSGSCSAPRSSRATSA